MELKDINKKFVYASDGNKDRWIVMKEVNGKLTGDCEDYSLTVAYHELEQSMMSLLWNILIGKYKMHFVRVKTTRDGHAVLQKEDKYIDNFTKRWVNRSTMERYHDFRHRYWPTTIYIKMLVGKLLRK